MGFFRRSWYRGHIFGDGCAKRKRACCPPQRSSFSFPSKPNIITSCYLPYIYTSFVLRQKGLGVGGGEGRGCRVALCIRSTFRTGGRRFLLRAPVSTVLNEDRPRLIALFVALGNGSPDCIIGSLVYGWMLQVMAFFSLSYRVGSDTEEVSFVRHCFHHLREVKSHRIPQIGDGTSLYAL